MQTYTNRRRSYVKILGNATEMHKDLSTEALRPFRVAAGQRLGLVLEELELTYVKFARELGISRNTVASMVAGTSHINDWILWHLQRRYHISANWILGGIGDMYVSEKRTPVQTQRLILRTCPDELVFKEAAARAVAARKRAEPVHKNGGSSK